MKAIELINRFNLQAHPEGGYFKEVYRSKGEIASANLGAEFDGNRNYCTSIYFLLTADKFSAFHKISQDEIWHFYTGTTLKLHMISPDGNYSFVLIGTNFNSTEIPQFTVPAHYYFAAEVLEKDSFSFVGCTVLPNCKQLTKKFPEHSKIIERLTHS
jgi:hypothetical protein